MRLSQRSRPRLRRRPRSRRRCCGSICEGAMREEDGALVLPGSSIRVKMWWEK